MPVEPIVFIFNFMPPICRIDVYMSIHNIRFISGINNYRTRQQQVIEQKFCSYIDTRLNNGDWRSKSSNHFKKNGARLLNIICVN